MIPLPPSFGPQILILPPAFTSPRARRFARFAAAPIVAGVTAAVLLAAVPQRSPAAAQPRPGAPLPASAGFVRRSGSRLLLGGRPFRFGGANIYWLGLDENDGPVAYPTRFRIDDALETAKDMGATVVRGQTLGISTGNALSVEPALGKFNSRAFAPIDYAVYRARQLGLKLVIPLTDYWNYYHGGIYSFTSWLGRPPCHQSDCPAQARFFYTSPAAISAFKQYIRHLLNHVNVYTGVPYKADPAIMSWELGNELNGMPRSWITAIAAFIHRLAPHQLVSAGQQAGIGQAALSAPGVDIIDVHYYPPAISRIESDAARVAAAGKAYFAGEYGSTSASQPLLAAMAADRHISGAAFWSLFAHNDTYGYVHHRDGFTLHYPGDTARMTRDGQAIRRFDVRMTEGGRGPVPPPPAPGRPLITSISQRGGKDVIAWRGTTDAGTYRVQRSVSGPSGPWMTVCSQCAASMLQARRAQRAAEWYRVIPYTLQGRAGPASAPGVT